jgi:putative FmdB family regulatory protein
MWKQFSLIYVSTLMPLYEYQCKKCKHRFEKILKFSDKPIKKCPECGGVVEQMISAPAVQFKGSGWYVTDYANKSQASSSDSGKESKTADTAKSESSSKDISSKESSSKESSSKESSSKESSSSSSKESSKTSSSKKSDKRK